MPSIAQITFLVREYDEAIEFFAQKLGFSLREDTDMGSGKRWVAVQPPRSCGCSCDRDGLAGEKVETKTESKPLL